MLQGGAQVPRTSSVGRLFDGVASLIGVHQRSGFEGQTAMLLEFAHREDSGSDAYPLTSKRTGPGVPAADGRSDGARRLTLDWAPLLDQVIADWRTGRPASDISVRFHNALANVIVSVASEVRETRVVLSGGCFQNRRLLERSVGGLRRAGFQPYWHQRVPSNDGGIALGQIMAGARPDHRRLLEP
jgi:hydrogenase maturation protein HypF